MEFLWSVSCSSRVTQHSWAVVVVGACLDHVLEFDFIARCHDGEVGDAAHVGKIVASMMGRSIVSDQTSTVQNHPHGEVLDSNIVNDLIVASLHEGRVDTNEGLQSLTGHTCSHRDGVLFRDTDIKGPLRETPTENVHSGATGHGSRNTHNGTVFRGGINEGVGENRRQGGIAGCLLGLHSGSEVELSDTVHLVTSLFGRWVAKSLHRLEVQQHRFVVRTVPKFLKNRDEVVQVVSVNGPDIVETQFFKQCTSRDDSASVLIDTLVDSLDVLWQEFVEALSEGPKVLEGLRHQKVRRVGRKLRGRDGTSSARSSGRQTDLTVVVQDDDHTRTEVSGTVHCLVGHATSNRTISNHGDAIVLAFVEHRLGDTHALSSRDGRRRMASAKRIVRTLLALAKTRDAVELAKT